MVLSDNEVCMMTWSWCMRNVTLCYDEFSIFACRWTQVTLLA